jgi:LPS-assembly protein
VLNIDLVLGFRPQAKFREVYYSRGVTSQGVVHRETGWVALEGTSRLSRRYATGEGNSLLHTLEPSVIYEWVPRSDQSDIVQVDDVDNLPTKNLLTYSLRTRLLEHRDMRPTNWLDLTVAQSYHLGSTPNQARQFILPGDPLFGSLPPFGSITQPIQPPLVPVQVKKFSDIWTRAVIGNPVGYIRGLDQTLTIDSFYNPYQGTFSQWNTDLRFQYDKLWYVEVGQRYTHDGNRPRRGDIWNPISFNEVFAPTPELNFVTAAGAFKAPLGWTIGARSYYDIKSGGSPETDVVALYRNPCQCWAVGFYYITFPDRVQYNFMLTLTGVGSTENFGTQMMKYLLQPLLVGERALPWPSPMGKRPVSPGTASSVGPAVTQPMLQ